MSTVGEGGSDRKWLLDWDKSSRNVTKGEKGSWVGVSLPPGRSLVPTHYALRHGWHSGYGRLRHWELRGSSDGKEWVALKKHNDGGSASFERQRQRDPRDEGFLLSHFSSTRLQYEVRELQSLRCPQTAVLILAVPCSADALPLLRADLPFEPMDIDYLDPSG
jgi:hypothetical protein